MKNALRLLCAVTLTLSTLAGPSSAEARVMRRPPPLVAAPGQRVELGDNYQITRVARVGGVVSVSVSMGGGCAEHSFEARYRVDGNAVIFWLRHDGHHDSCEALITRDVLIALPAGLPANATLAVRGPGGTSYPVR